MFIISLYHTDLIPLPHQSQMKTYGQNQSSHIERKRTQGAGGGQPSFPDALPSGTAQIGRAFKQGGGTADGNVAYIGKLMGEAFHAGGDHRAGDPSGTWAQADNGQYGRGSCQQGHRGGQAEREQSAGSQAESHGQGSERPDIQAFFISIGARYKRIRKRPRGVPSPQLYAYKSEKLQELEHLNRDGKIDLYYADESHVCTEGYVPYGWQFRDEDVYVPS